MRNKIALSAFALVVSSFFGAEGRAQGVQLSASTQELGVFGKVYNGVKGSPFLYEDWTSGKVKLTDGTVYEGLKLMYDQVKDEVIFSVEENNAQRFMHPIREFTMEQTVNTNLVVERTYRSGLPAFDGNTGNSFYEVLSEGNTQLLKRTFKTIVEERAPNERVPSKQMKATERYYLLKDGELQKIRKDKKSFLAALSDKSSQLDQYFKSKRVNFKNEEDLAALVAYYNSL